MIRPSGKLILFILFVLSSLVCPAFAKAKVDGVRTQARRQLIAKLKSDGLIRPMMFVPIAPGRFRMGCIAQPGIRYGCGGADGPVEVELTYGFEMQDTEVTQ